VPSGFARLQLASSQTSNRDVCATRHKKSRAVLGSDGLAVTT
jgi:hypothetical protein